MNQTEELSESARVDRLVLWLACKYLAAVPIDYDGNDEELASKCADRAHVIIQDLLLTVTINQVEEAFGFDPKTMPSYLS